jgi:ABC-2 type transport system ATP-binding protein
MIEVAGLTKDYGARRAIDNLTFNANQGEVLGFLGPNGAGKTTTMRILTGFMPPTAGEAKVAGFDVVEQSLEVRKRIGYLPETVPLYPDMTVYDYLKFMADLRRLENAEERIDDVLEIDRAYDGSRRRIYRESVQGYAPENWPCTGFASPSRSLDPG